MTETNEKEQKYISIGKAAEYLGVSKDTLRRWEKAGRIVCHRTPGDRRRYLKEDLDKVLEGKLVESQVEEPVAPAPKLRAPGAIPKAPRAFKSLETATPPQQLTKQSFISKSRETFKKIFKSKEEKERGKLPTHYISTPAGPRRITIRKPKLSTFTDKFTDKLRFINIHTLIFISVLVTTAIATILIFYMLFQGEAPERIEVPKVKIPKIRDEAKGRILSPIP